MLLYTFKDQFNALNLVTKGKDISSHEKVGEAKLPGNRIGK